MATTDRWALFDKTQEGQREVPHGAIWAPAGALESIGGHQLKEAR